LTRSHLTRLTSAIKMQTVQTWDNLFYLMKWT